MSHIFEIVSKVKELKESLIERCETMAKKATKKIVAKPEKKSAEKVKAKASKTAPKKSPKIAPKADVKTKVESKKTASKGESKTKPKTIETAKAPPSSERSTKKVKMEQASIAVKIDPPKKLDLNSDKKSLTKNQTPKAKKVPSKKEQGSATDIVVEEGFSAEVGVSEAIVAEPVPFESMPSKRAKKYEGATEEESKWLELRDKHRNIKPNIYRISDVFQERTPIEHKTLGWGFILSVVNDRLEVLFRSGIKQLISNYKTRD